MAMGAFGTRRDTRYQIVEQELPCSLCEWVNRRARHHGGWMPVQKCARPASNCTYTRRSIAVLTAMGRAAAPAFRWSRGRSH